MTGYTVCAAALMAGGLPAALFVVARGRASDRLIGMEIVSAVVVIAMLLISQITDQSYELIVPLVLVVLSAAGTLVFTRLIGGSEDGP